MPKLTKKAIRYSRTDERTDGRKDPNYRKALLLTIAYDLSDFFFISKGIRQLTKLCTS
jgi:hypothetical protein